MSFESRHNVLPVPNWANSEQLHENHVQEFKYSGKVEKLLCITPQLEPSSRSDCWRIKHKSGGGGINRATLEQRIKLIQSRIVTKVQQGVNSPMAAIKLLLTWYTWEKKIEMYDLTVFISPLGMKAGTD